MIKKSTIKENILYYLEVQGITMYDFYKKTGVSNGVLSQKTGMSEENTMRFLSYYKNVNPIWLLTNEGPMLKPDKKTIARAIDSERKTKDAIYENQRVPLFNLEATMGLVPLVDGNGVDEEKVIDYISIPSMPSCDGAIYASGDSMYPLLKSGDMIAYKRIEVERANIFFGEMYIVAVKLDESSTMKTIKFVHQSELGDDYIKLVSHNQHHTPKDIRLSQIAAIGLVRASIRMHN